jgi:Flp pilus assembly protein TadD
VYGSYNTYNYYDSDYDVGARGMAAPYASSTTNNYWVTQPVSGAALGAATSRADGSVYTYSHRRAGLQAFFNGDYDLARREFVRALLAEPDDPELVMLYGFAHFATGDYLVATLALRRALGDDPTLIDRPVDIYRLYGKPDDLAAHVDSLDRHLAADPADQDARFLAGFVRYAAGQADEAVAVFARLATEAPDDLLSFIMRDAALRAEVLQRASERADTDAATPESSPTSPARNESVPESC